MPIQEDYKKKFGRKWSKKVSKRFHNGKSWNEVKAELRRKGEL